MTKEPVMQEQAVDGVQERLAGLWTLLLRKDGPPRPEDHFFRSGGHSLLAVQLCARIQSEFGVAADVNFVFRYPLLADMAVAIGERISDGSEPPPAPIRPRNRPTS